MTLKLSINTDSLKAQRMLGKATDALSGIYERLSSGQRINRASDDAAGLAIAEDLNARSRVYNQGIRNANDGISLMSVAESAVDALSQIVSRIQELATQASNGAYSSSQRRALDSEAQELSEEYTRIIQTTTYNSIKLFDGSLRNGLNLQLGYGSDGTIRTGVGGTKGTGTFSSSTLVSTATVSMQVQNGDFNNDGFMDLVSTSSPSSISVRLGNGDGTFGAAQTFSSGSVSSLNIADVNSDGILDILTTEGTKANVFIGSGTGSFGTAIITSVASWISTTGDVNNDGFTDLIVTDSSSSTTFSVLLGNGTGTFGSKTTYTANTASDAISTGDFNGDGFLDIASVGLGTAGVTVLLNSGSGSFTSKTLYTVASSPYRLAVDDLNNDGVDDLVTYSLSGLGSISALIGNGDGTFGTRIISSTSLSPGSNIESGDFNGDGFADLITSHTSTERTVSILLGNGTGSFGSATLYSTSYITVQDITIADFTGDGVIDIVTSHSGTSTISFLSGNSEEGISPLLDFSLKSRSDALQAVSILRNASSTLIKQRGVIGSHLSRLEIAVDGLKSSVENFRAAASRITDADIAAESSNLIRQQILQQSATAVLAQTNQNSDIVMRLLSSDRA